MAPKKKDGVREQLGTLEQRAQALYDEDWEFRAFLNEQESMKVDAIVQRLFQEASENIDCRQCLNCCHELSPQFDDEDITKFSKGLGIPASVFIERYLIEDDDEPGMYLMRDQPCPFLGKDGCLHYELRPKECVDFPHLDKKDFLCRTMSVISDQAVCPIVFHVYQGLKAEPWGKRDRAKRGRSKKS
jgi:Fe-S-cluster containining protein